MSETPPAEVGDVIAGRYRIVKMLGQGGMGAVYQALQISMERMVALKLILPKVASHSDAVKRFHREMQATSRIEHPNIISVYDYGEDGERFFLAMEFLDGKPLSKILEAGALPPKRVLHIAAQIVRALGAAHQMGIAHRDLKPDNVMLIKRYDEPDFVKVLDFGIARFLDDEQNQAQVSQMTAAGALIGTPMYMSPEQALGHPIDHRSDFYSLGVMLYQMALGQLPFTGPTLASLIVAHAHEEPVAPSIVQPGVVPPGLEALIMRLLAKPPDQRPATAAELLAAIDACRESMGPMTANRVPVQVDPLAHTAADGARGSTAQVPVTTGTAQRTAEVAPLAPPAAAEAAPAPRRGGSMTGVLVGVALAVVVGGGIGAWKFLPRDAAPKPVPDKPVPDKPVPDKPVAVANAARAGLEELWLAAGDPLAPLSCRTSDPAMIDTLKKATSNLTDSFAGSARTQDTRAAQLLAGVKDGPAEYWMLVARARAATDPGNPGAALEAAQKAVAACPDFAAAHNAIGNAELRAKHLDQAEAAYQKALALDAEYLQAKFNLALIALSKGDAATAITGFDEVIKKNPQHPRAALVRGRAHLVLKHYPEAIADLESALLLNPDLPDDWVLLGKARAAAGQDKASNEAFCKAKEKGSAEGGKLCK